MNSNLLLITKSSLLEEKTLFNKGYSMVSSFRKKKIDGYRNINDKCLSLACELLLKYGFNLLNEDINLEDINYDGKPYLNDNYYFNFSHSNEYTVCAISKDEIGIDIERIKDFNLNVAKRCFNENEYNNLLKLKDEELKRKLFFDYWTAKEAFVKNIGTGIKTPFNSFEIIFDDEIRINQNINDKEYYFKKVEIENYSLCVCSLNNLNIEVLKVDLNKI